MVGPILKFSVLNDALAIANRHQQQVIAFVILYLQPAQLLNILFLGPAAVGCTIILEVKLEQHWLFVGADAVLVDAEWVVAQEVAG